MFSFILKMFIYIKKKKSISTVGKQRKINIRNTSICLEFKQATIVHSCQEKNNTAKLKGRHWSLITPVIM